MARQQGKLIFLSDSRTCLPPAEHLRRQTLMDMALQTAGERDDATVLISDRLEGPFVPVDAWDDVRKADKVALYAAGVRDRLSFFLDMIDQCDVLFQDREGDKLIFLVAVDADDHLDLVHRAIAAERRLLEELGIDQNDVHLDGRGMLRVLVPLPDDHLAV